MVNLQEKSQSANILPPSEVILQKLCLDSKQVKLIEPLEKRSHYRATINWLTKYQPDFDVSNLEKVKGLLESFSHLCEVEDWEAAKSMLTTELDTPNGDEVYWQLGIWGYFREQTELCQQILGKLDAKSDGIWLNALGEGYYRLGKYKLAIDFHQQHLAIAQELGDRLGESASLGNLGTIYGNLGQYECAIDFHQKALLISREIGDRRSESQDLGNLAIVYKDMGQYERAIYFYEQSLAIDQEIGDRRGEAISLGNMGRAYCALGNYAKALDLQRQRLAIIREIGSRTSESYALNGLGEAFIKLEQHTNALKVLQNALKICQENGNKPLEALVLKNLAELYLTLEEVEKAQWHCQQAFLLQTELGIPLPAEWVALQLRLEHLNNLNQEDG